MRLSALHALRRCFAHLFGAGVVGGRGAAVRAAGEDGGGGAAAAEAVAAWVRKRYAGYTAALVRWLTAKQDTWKASVA